MILKEENESKKTGESNEPTEKSPLLINALVPSMEEISSDETHPSSPDIVAQFRELKAPASVLIQTGSYSISVLLMALHISYNGKLLSLLGEDGPGAASIVSTVQTVVLGMATGCVLSTGIEIGKPIGAKKYARAGDVARTAWVLTSILGVTCTAILATSHQTLPWFFSNPDQTGNAADFFAGYCIGTFPTMFLMTGPQIAFQAGDWKVPSLVAASNYLPAAILSYVFGFPLKMGAFGIGLGGGVAPWVAATGLHIRFLTSRYSPLRLYQCHTNDFPEHMKGLLITGAKLTMQRMTEWGNLFLITYILGLWDYKELNAENASLQYLVILNLFAQGLAHGTGMIIRRDRGNIESKLTSTNRDIEGARLLHHRNKMTIIRNTLVGAGINTTLGVCLYLAREPLSKFFLSESNSKATFEMAETFLWINAIGLLPDAVRIIVAGALRGWNDINWSTGVSLITMSILGVPVSWGLGKYVFDEDPDSLFIVRNIAMTAAAGIICWRAFRKYAEDTRNYFSPEKTRESSINTAVPKRSFWSKLAFWSSPKPVIIEEEKGELKGILQNAIDDPALR